MNRQIVVDEEINDPTLEDLFRLYIERSHRSGANINHNVSPKIPYLDPTM